MNSHATILRTTVESIRRKPYPITDLIPQLCKAADELDSLQVENEMLRADAARYQRLAAYLVNDECAHDDAIVSAKTVDELSQVIDSVMKGAQNA